MASMAPFQEDSWPRKLVIDRQKYQQVDVSKALIFWNELQDAEGGMVGLEFGAPELETFLKSDFVQHSSNVKNDRDWITILLRPVEGAKIECTQHFGSMIYVNIANERDCILCIYGWAINFVSFDIQPVSTPADSTSNYA